MRTYLFLSLAAVLLAAGCKKNDPEAGLPPATHTGANTAGCLVNGERFVATGYSSGLSRVGAMSGGFFYDSLYYLEMSGVQSGRNVDITLFIRSQVPGSYALNKNTPSLIQGGLTFTLDHATYTVSNNTGETYITDYQHTGQVELTNASRGSGISAGTFEFTAASTFDRSKTVTITSGRFDRQQ